METFSTYALLIVGIILIVKCGDWFVDGASWLARITGLPTFIVGATVVSFGTTLPEIIVSAIAAYEGKMLNLSGNYADALEKVGMSIGNGIGSVICNTALIMAISIIFMPMAVKRKSFAPKSIILCISVITLWAVTFFTQSLQLWGAIILFAIFAIFLAENIYSSRSEKDDDPDEPKKDKKSIIKNIFFIVGGAAGIAIGSDLLVDSGSSIAASLGVSQSVIGLTIVAVGTSLPELVTTVTSIIKRQPSLSVGNVIGANIIDIVLILPICSLVFGNRLPVLKQNIYLDFPVCILVCLIAVVPTIFTKNFRRWQGIAMLIIYITYLFIVCGFQQQYFALFN